MQAPQESGSYLPCPTTMSAERTRCTPVRTPVFGISGTAGLEEAVIFMVIVRVGQWLMASCQAPTQVDKAPTVASVLPNPPPLNSGE